MVLFCDPVAIALTAGISTAIDRCLKRRLVPSAFDRCRADVIERHSA
jgi:hypothetical protein